MFTWWSGNGDMHLKNFSLFVNQQGIQQIAPAYDLLCTHLVIPDDPLALPIQGRRQKLTARSWIKFADCCGLPEKAAARILRKQAAVLEAAVSLVKRSYLPQPQQEIYEALLRSRTAALIEPGSPAGEAE